MPLRPDRVGVDFGVKSGRVLARAAGILTRNFDAMREEEGLADRATFIIERSSQGR